MDNWGDIGIYSELRDVRELEGPAGKILGCIGTCLDLWDLSGVIGTHGSNWELLGRDLGLWELWDQPGVTGCVM